MVIFNRIPTGTLIGTSVDLTERRDAIVSQMENVIGSLGNLTGLNKSGGMQPKPGVPKPEGAGTDAKVVEDQGRLLKEWMEKNQSLITMLTVGSIIVAVIGYTYLR